MSAILFGALLLTSGVHAQQSSSNNSDPSSSQQKPSQQDKSVPANRDAKAKTSSNDNAFPEDVSRQAEQQKKTADQAAADQPSASDATGQAPSNPQQGSDSNAFPEETSRKAEAAAKSAAGDSSSSSGVSSSSDYDDRVNGGRKTFEPNVPMTHIHTRDQAKEDVYVGTFYLQSGDYVGAYNRFKEASILHPENVDAMFGLAEAARHLKKNEEAMENYRLYLDVVPSGAKAKDARKALSLLEKPH